MLLRAILPAVFAGAVVLGNVVPAAADPEPVMCNFSVSSPSVVDVSGTPKVMAEITVGACTGVAKPTFTQVCLSAADSSTAGRCAELPGYNAARVYLSPYRPGTAYTARGRGCAAQTNPPAPICTTVGPTTVTL